MTRDQLDFFNVVFSSFYITGVLSGFFSVLTTVSALPHQLFVVLEVGLVREFSPEQTVKKSEKRSVALFPEEPFCAELRCLNLGIIGPGFFSQGILDGGYL